MTVKSGQKCTAIRRVLVPEHLYDAAAQAISARLAKTTVGNPRNEAVRMGSRWSAGNIISRRLTALPRSASRHRCCTMAKQHALVDADPAVAACVGPTLLGTS